ncbi:MAG: hypothetical protein RIR79_2372, partial [Pseudomonadota bacterium]
MNSSSIQFNRRAVLGLGLGLGTLALHGLSGCGGGVMGDLLA